MSTPRELIGRLLEHMTWADARLVDALDDARLVAIERLAHVLACELLWLDRIEGRSPSIEVWPVPSATTCRDLLEQSRARTRRLIDELRDEDLGRPVAYTNSMGRAFDTPLEDILLHVILHGMYHRGQVAMLLAGDGRPTPSTDFIELVRGVPAAPRQRNERGSGDDAGAPVQS